MKIKKIQIIGVILLLITILAGLLPQVAHAGALNRSNTMSSLRVNTLSNHEIIFRTPTGVDAPADTITITFPAGFTMGTFALLNFDLGVSVGGQTSCPIGLSYAEETLAGAAAAGVWGVAQAGQVITFTAPTNATVGEVAANACVRIRIGNNAVTGGTGVNQITNHTVAASYTIAIAGTFGDSGNILVTILSDDRVAITSTVVETMTFILGATSVGLGNLSSLAAVTGSHTVTLATNAASGFVLTYSGTTLTSGAHTITAMSTTVPSSIGTEQFGINAVLNTTPAVGAACSGTAPIAAAAINYNTANNFRFVSGETIISSSAGINSTTCTISYLTNIAGATEAGAYTTTLTYTATATF